MPLISALNDNDNNVRLAVIKALGEINDTRAIDPLVKILNYDKNNAIRFEIIRTLYKIGDDRVVEPLIFTLIDENRDIRKLAREALKKIKPNWAKGEIAKKNVENFIKLLNDIRDEVRLGAIEVLKEIGDVRAIEPLIKLINDHKREIRQAATEAIIHFKPYLKQFNSHYPYILCKEHFLRSEKIIINIEDNMEISYLVCRGCRSSVHLLPSIKEVIGLIGGDIDNYKIVGEKFYVNLWSNEKARNADIDTIEISESSKTINYELALASIYTTLYNDISRTKEYVKRIKVVIRKGVVLSNDTLNFLKSKFGDITYADGASDIFGRSSSFNNI